MDSAHFDRLVADFVISGTRRRLLRLLTGVPLAGAVATHGDEAATAPRRKRRRLRNRRQSGNDKDNRKGKRKGQDQDQGVGRPLDCPNATISCYIRNEQGACAQLVGSFGPVGHCGDFICCPCDHPDQGYWVNLCNTTFPACNGGCTAGDDLFLIACFTPTDSCGVAT
jgi:hypothetical protein